MSLTAKWEKELIKCPPPKKKTLKGLKRGMASNLWAVVIKLLVTDVAANLALAINVALYDDNTAPGVVAQIQSLAGIIRKINPT